MSNSYLLLRGQEDDSLSNFTCSCHTIQGDVVSRSNLQSVQLWLRHSRPPVQVGLCEAGCHCVDSNAKGRQLHGSGLCEHLETSLAHAVAQQTWLRSTPLLAAHVDDASFGVAEELYEELLEDEGRAQIDVHHLVVGLRARRLNVTHHDLAYHQVIQSKG